ncbi:DegT/DnrJ/EryC1/StrS aminotransferase family protein [Halomonas sp. LR5S13]|uniref:DegT/DnrJ/EryC1/StrS family aminotransferase n=1 Tax=Halomonas rhizosphaerae TaxID=3043296 RepID=UPI0024A92530|nr:DegT/DnrJ/EryC1/StrS aminotransferase family protein [Halomonas rhizosphaerae]MDI5920849.1 DegT/DnrJ/EryC1/StrS aminotransferase family protein [Halomonas rhizosphaerae]
MLNGPFSPWPSFTETEAMEVSRVLLSNHVNYWTGEEGRCFEQEFSEYVGSRYAVAVANGTLALELALRGLGIGHGDEVIVSPRTFLASASSVVAVGAVPVFADVDADSQNITAPSIAEKITPRTRAILAVHLAGWPCEMDEINALARSHDLYVVEDCAQAHGAKYRGKSVGCLGAVGAWSFCQDKIISTGGEGGMVTTDDPALWEKMWSYKDHGKSWKAVYDENHPPGFRWLHESFGSNLRMMEVQAVIGRIQLRFLPEWSRTRQANMSRVLYALRGCRGLRVPLPPDHVEHAAYKGYVFIQSHLLKSDWNRDRIIGEVNFRGVPLFGGSCPEVYLEKAFVGTDFCPRTRLPVARELGETSLMFLVHPKLKSFEIEKTINVIRDVMMLACR